MKEVVRACTAVIEGAPLFAYFTMVGAEMLARWSCQIHIEDGTGGPNADI
jgi:hypothetical protein